MGIIRDSFVIFSNWDTAIRQAPEDKQLELYRALMDFAKTGELPENISWEASMFLTTLKENMERTVSRYAASVENGKKGGRPRDENPSEEALKKREYREERQTKDKPKTNLDKPDKPNAKRTNLNDNVNVNVNVNDNNYKLVNKIYNNHERAREDANFEVFKNQYLERFEEFFEYTKIDKFANAGHEVINCMAVAKIQAGSEEQLRFNSKIINAEDFDALISKINNDKFCSIVSSVVFKEDIQNREYYILGCIFAKGV